MTPEQTILPSDLPRSMILPATDTQLPPLTDYNGCTFKEARERFEIEFIRHKLKEYAGNVSKTAEAIEIERSNLHRKIKAFGIETSKD